jgi:gamma-glutamyltranspeptidase/glutathione hydrolase
MRGVAVCPQPAAAETGAVVLAGGGNAFDAAIAAAFVQMVVDPQMCGLGGFGCATMRTPETCLHLGFHARIGSRATPDMWMADLRGRTAYGGLPLFDDHRSNLGHRSVGTPGTVAGLAALHAHARLPWAELLAPAAALSREGFPATAAMFDMLRHTSGPGMPTELERMAHTPDSAALWLRPDGTFKQPGDQWENRPMADTLDRLAQTGAGDFYRGELAQAIAAELERGGGYVTAADLAGYRVRSAPPPEGRYRGLQVCSSTPPAGGLTVVQTLQIMDRFPPGTLRDPGRYRLMAAAMQAAFAFRAANLGDPEFVAIPAEEGLGARWADEQAARIAAQPVQPAAAPAPPGTTHLSVCDEAGNLVALTHTLGRYSGVTVTGTGIPLNSAMDLVDPLPGRPNSIAPGKARASGMAPTLVFRNGLPVLVTGSPGTHAIITCVAQVIVAVVDLGLSPVEAVSLPRVHTEGGAVLVEGRVPQAAADLLASEGFTVERLTENYAPLLGRNQLIVLSPDGSFEGASDPRRDGGIAAYSAA